MDSASDMVTMENHLFHDCLQCYFFSSCCQWLLLENTIVLLVYFFKKYEQQLYLNLSNYNVLQEVIHKTYSLDEKPWLPGGMKDE